MSTTTTRRALLKGAPAAAALAAIPTSAAFALSASDTTGWDRAYAHYQHADTQYRDLCDACERASELAADAVPRVDRFFDEYKLGVGMKQETVLFWLAHYDLQHPGRIDQKREADEFMAYQQRVIEARKRFRTKEYDRAREAYYQTFDEARDNLMATAAPTRQALLVKMEVAALALGDEYLESTLADAQRLLGRGA